MAREEARLETEARILKSAGGDDDERPAATSTRFALCDRQRPDGQDHDAASRLGCGANRAAEGRQVQLRVDRRQPGTRGARRLRSRYRERDFPRRTTFAEVGVKKKSFCGSIDSDKPCLHIDFGKFRDANVPAIEALIGSRYMTLNNSIQDRSYIRQPLGYTLLGDGRIAPFAMQFRPGVRQWNADRPRGGRRQQPRHLRQCRADHEALHRAQFQRQHEGQSVRDRASRRFRQRAPGFHRRWKTSPSSTTRPT